MSGVEPVDSKNQPNVLEVDIVLSGNTLVSVHTGQEDGNLDASSSSSTGGSQSEVSTRILPLCPEQA